MRKINPAKENWKTLVILDSCRYDYFKEVNFIKGKLFKVDTRCSNTHEWYAKYWCNKFHSNTVLVHGIHFVEKFGNFFARAYRMWNYENMLKIDEQISFAEKVLKEIGDKRVLIHFLQPHIPFNNPKGKKLLRKLKTSGKGLPEDHDKITIYGNKYGWNEIKEAYKEEIKYVLKKITDSKIEPDVISADHGIRIGEDKTFRHGAHTNIVHTVPWLEVEK